MRRPNLLIFAAVVVLGTLGFSQSAAAQTNRKTREQQKASSTVITANPYIGTPISKYDPRVSRYSPYGATNPYTTSGGQVHGQDGQYLGTLNANRYDPNSVANPYGVYGSRYSPTSINNPYSAYGSTYSNKSAKNPYATAPPVVTYPTYP